MEARGVNALGEDAFMKLLTTQLRFQDPLKPLDSTEFVSQLAQFTQLEQTTAMKKLLQSSTKQMESLNNYGAAGLIGKEVQGVGGRLNISDSKGTDFSYRLEQDAKEATLMISDQSGTLVRALRMPEQEKGVVASHWDGRDQDGRQVSVGEYTYSISASDAAGNPVTSTTYTRGRVTGVSMEGGVAYLTVNGERIAASSVSNINN